MRKRFLSSFGASLAAFALAVALLGSWLGTLSRDSGRRQREALELALSKSLLLCYSLDGCYPPTLEALLERCPLSYDRERFAIDYRLQGANILPDITILESPR